MDQLIQPQKKDNKTFWAIFLTLIILVLLFFSFSLFYLARSLSKGDDYDNVSGGKGGKIGVIELNYVIISPDEFVRQFKKFREDKSIKAILLRINSPGGGVAASQEMYEAVKKTRDSGKPVIVSFGSIAASGGYYIACGSSKIISNPGTLTGSIGVIAQFISIKDLAEKWGIEQTTIKSGELKDAGNPFKKMNDKDKAYFQDVVDNSFDQFLEVVSRERKIDKNKLLEYSNGRVFTGLQAKDIGLVDEIGTYEDAVNIAAKIAGIDGEPALIKERERKSLLERILDSKFSSGLKEIKDDLQNEYLNQPVLQYKFVK